MQTYEKLGIFYLGRLFDPKTGKTTHEPLLYESKHLTTHAICIGMTGSGKTGLGIGLLEEAGIDNIPAIIVDPKGDLGNLLLTFPDLSPKEFLPWVDPSEAERKGVSLEQAAETAAKTWQEGLASWDEGADRIRNLRKAVDIAIYTPASNAGRPISILSSFKAPSKETLDDPEAMRDRVMTTVSSLLGLIGIDADPIKSREHILLSTLIDRAWRQGDDVDIGTLIQQVRQPPFEKIGALDVDTVFPVKDRTALAIALNNLLASPGFQAWMTGEPLDIQSLLYTSSGKPRLAVLSIAHLSDNERMFFVTLLLNQLLAWMRRQPGTSSLRALFFMDEIFGFFPPTAMPPSKTPLLTLLKQARAFGLGLFLSTQNPVDLDYKGLSNCGTWFIGKLQTERDKARVLEGLNQASNGEFNAASLDKIISSMGSRVFIMRSIYEKEPIIFQTRWTLSYLRGPLTLTQISSLTEKRQPEPKAAPLLAVASTVKEKPTLINCFGEFFLIPEKGNISCYKPFIAGRARVRFTDAKAKADLWNDFSLVAPIDSRGKSVDWDSGIELMSLKDRLSDKGQEGIPFASLPEILHQNPELIKKAYAAWLSLHAIGTLFTYPPLKLTSNDGEDEGSFKQRVLLVLREKRDEAVRKLQEKYGQKITAITAKLKRAQDKASLQQQQAGIQKTEAWISVGTTLLGTLFGRGVTKGSINQAGTSMRRMGRATKESSEAQQAAEECNLLQQQLQALQTEMDNEAAAIPMPPDPSLLKIDKQAIAPRKTEIEITDLAVIWWPS